MPELLNQAKNNDARFFLQFGGQGSPWIKEMVKQYDNNALRPLFDVAFRAIDECLADPDVQADKNPLPHGLDIRAWLENSDSIPSDFYLSCAAVSVPMIGLVQMGHLFNLIDQGYDLHEVLPHTAGITGHSQGIVPAAMTGLGKSGDELLVTAGNFIKFLFYLGFRAQQPFPQLQPSEADAAASEEMGDKGLAPMAAVLNCKADRLQQWVDAMNQELSEKEKLHISLYNMPDSNIISSLSESLLKFRQKFKAEMDAEEVKMVYLKVSAPFHCPLVSGSEEKFSKDLEKFSFPYKGSDLKVPVYSINDGRDYRDEAELAPILFRETVIQKLFWNKAIGSLLEKSDVTHVLDFGPGKVSQRLTQSWLTETDIKVLGAANPKDLKAMLA